MSSILIKWIFILNTGLSPCSFICWKDTEKLNWDYFLGEPKSFSISYGDSAQAVSNLTIIMGLDSNNEYTAKAVFNKNLSWYVEKSDLLLQHEQGHFDLTEVYARLLRKKVDHNEGDSDFDINSLYKETLMELDSVSEKYDAETLHGSILVQQKKWDTYFEERLNELSEYSDNTDFCPCN